LRPPIILCYDGSPAAARAVKAAGTLFPGQPTIVLYAYPGVHSERIHTTPVEVERREPIEEVHVAAKRDAAAIAEQGTNIALSDGLAAKPLTIQAADGAAGAILRVATQQSAAAVVIARGNRTRLGLRQFGTVSRKIVNHCPVRVLLV